MPTSPTSRGIRRWMYDIERAVRDTPEDLVTIIERHSERRRLAKAIQSIRKRRYARITKLNGVLVLEITREGKRALLPFATDQLRILPPPTWDKKWRVILFDIPETQRVGRDVLRKRLRDLGFYALQRSAFVLPYPCFDQLDILIRSLHITPYVTFFETDSLGYHEAQALAHFRLERKRR